MAIASGMSDENVFEISDILAKTVYNIRKAEDVFSVFAVTLLAEGVGRNTGLGDLYYKEHKVTLLAEGVGRNPQDSVRAEEVIESPSSRRVWVEILDPIFFLATLSVTLLAEGVGRNAIFDIKLVYTRWSPSSRRVWVEIVLRPGCPAWR